MTTYNSAKYGNVEAGGVENKLINGDFLSHKETWVQLSHQQPLLTIMTLLTL